MRYTYSRWDNTQLEGFDANDLMAALSDHMIADGDVESALQRVVRWGARTEGSQLPGVQDLLDRVRAERQRQLEQYRLDSMLDDIERQLSEILRAERRAIDRKIEEARRAEGGNDWTSTLESIARRKGEQLNELPAELGARMNALAEYEYLDEGARQAFDDLLDVLRRQVLQAHFETIKDSLNALTDGDIDELKSMMRDLNRALREHLDGQDPDFGRFMEQHGRYFPGARSFDEIAEQVMQQSEHMESVMRSMSPQMRRSLEETLRSVLWDEEIQEELSTMAETLHSMAPFRRRSPAYEFSGEESLTLQEAMQLMRRLHDLDHLERDIKRAHETGSMEHVDAESTRTLMGEDVAAAVSHLQDLAQVLERAGYVERHDGSLQLTARGMRVIGQKALEDIFQHLNRDAFGNHTVAHRGRGGDRMDETKPYEFGDNFLIDMPRTLMNGVMRAPGRHVRLTVDDFDVFRTEQLAQSSTVLMLDMSRSMPLRGCLVAAKKVALALNSLISTQFPRDRLYIIGFSDFARELQPEDLHRMSWSDYVYGTNMQHGFLVSRRLLGRHKAGNKQIILITDGEPTAHFEGERVHFAYPPTPRTFQETLREVKRCTQEGIVINTFMLERSHYLADFVNQMTRINRGRAFFATPERLGDYVLVDYVAGKSRSSR